MPETYAKGEEPVPGSGYRLVSFLGRGGFGEVWKASAPGGAEVAVKILNLAGFQGRKEFRALQLVKRVRHPNLVPVIAFWLKGADGSVLDDALTTSPDVLTDTSAVSAPLHVTAVPPACSHPQPEELVIVMGLGDKSLFDRLEECRREGLEGIPKQELLHYIEDAARAIDYLNNPVHDLGAGPAAIQHCDIKPHNIMIVADATQVCDFGLARMLGADRTTTAAATLAYAAPECLRDGKPSQSTDQYSLAVTYYELSTGALPYQEETAVAVMNAKLEGNLDFSRVSGDEEVVLRRATASDPQERYTTSLDMVKRLRAAVEGKPLGPPPRPGGLRRLVNALMVVAILGLVAYNAWRYWRPDGRNLPGDPAVQGQDPRKPDQIPPPAKVPADTFVALLERAAEHEQQGQFQPAIDAYTEAIHIEPENAEAYLRRGRCYLSLQKYDPAISDFEQAKGLDAAQYGTHAEFASAYLARGTRLLEAEAYEKAVPDLTEAIDHNPNDGRAFSRRSFARYRLEDLEGALEDLSVAIGIDHDDRDYVARGRILQKLGRLEEAIADFEEAGQRNPQNAESHYDRGHCYLKRLELDQAVEAFGEAIRIASQTGDSILADAYGSRGSCYASQDRFQEAVDDLNQAIRLSPDDVDFRDFRASCYQKLVIGALARVEQDPNDHEAHNEAAYYLATSPEPDIRDGTKAVEHAARACELTSWEEPEYLDTLAAAYAEAGEFNEAVQWAEKAVELAPDDEARDRYRKGLELYRAGKPFHESPTP